MASSSLPPNLSVAGLDTAVNTILQNNFDADTKACLITLMKVLDNVIQKPFDQKVRSIRLNNPAFSKKVASRKGGVDFLLACGFVQESPPPALLARDNEPQESFLVLKDDDDNLVDDTTRQTKREAYQSHIITARRLLLTRATRDLHMKAEELPAYKPPPPPVAMSTNFTSQNRNEPSAAFNPYQTHRHDGMSAAVGAQLTPDSTYVSKTDKQLAALKAQQEKLEKKIQKQLVDREWVATHPNASGKPTALPAAQTMEIDNNDKSSAGLIAAQFQKQQAQRKQREEGGFTTKNMRELERLKKQKVFSHTQLALQFSDGTVLHGKFLPKETIATVLTAMTDCFVETPSGNNMELYVTPPRKTLLPKSTLQDEGLVPAAKVFVKLVLPNHRPFLKPELFVVQKESQFPSSQPVVATKTKQQDDDASKNNNNKKAKPANSQEDKEAALLQRMMGGGRRLGGGSSGNKKPGAGKPKWFK